MRKYLSVVVCLLAVLVTASATANFHDTASEWLYREAKRQNISHVPDETPEQLDTRLRLVTRLLYEEATPWADGKGWTSTELAAAAEIIWNGETLFDKRVHAGEQHPLWSQDHMLARCGMQLHATGLVPQPIWEQLAGLTEDATRLCAKYGIRVIVAMAKQCGVYHGLRADRSRVAKTFAAYGSGGQCKPDDRAWERADRWIRVMATRPDHEKKTYPGFRRAAPGEIPTEVRTAAAALLTEIKDKKVQTGATRDVARYKLVVEHHAEGKTGVSVLVAER